MARWLRRKDGKLAGSVGDGKDRVPTAAAPLPAWHRDPDPSASMEIDAQFRGAMVRAASFRERAAMADLMHYLGDDNPEHTDTQWGPQNGQDVTRVLAAADQALADPTRHDAKTRERIALCADDVAASHGELVIAQADGGSSGAWDAWGSELKVCVERSDEARRRHAQEVRNIMKSVNAMSDGDDAEMVSRASSYLAGVAEARQWDVYPENSSAADLARAIRQYERHDRIVQQATAILNRS